MQLYTSTAQFRNQKLQKINKQHGGSSINDQTVTFLYGFTLVWQFQKIVRKWQKGKLTPLSNLSHFIENFVCQSSNLKITIQC